MHLAGISVMFVPVQAMSVLFIESVKTTANFTVECCEQFAFYSALCLCVCLMLVRSVGSHSCLCLCVCLMLIRSVGSDQYR